MKLTHQLNDPVIWVTEEGSKTTLEFFEGGFACYMDEILQYVSTYKPILLSDVEEFVEQSATIRELENTLLTKN